MGVTGCGGTIQAVGYDLCASHSHPGLRHVGGGLKCRGQHSVRYAKEGADAVPVGAALQEHQLPPCGVAAGVPGLGDYVSVVRAFTGATVLLTGATGYLGSLVMEQLLRVVPGIRRIYVIVRSKRGMSGEQRLEKLLQRSMWHLHHQDGRMRPEVRAKIAVVPGDLLLSQCGISGPTRRRLAREVDYVIHSAASISFNEHIHKLLAANYEATRNIANLAMGLSRLRAFVHLSTAYANCDRPRGSHVEERLYAMDYGRSASTGEVHTVQSLATELCGLSAEAASRQVEKHLWRVSMPNAYVFTKRMAEALISSYACEAFPVCIVRPSLVGCTARAPHPGYFGNNAGPTAIALAFAIGISTFTSHQADSVFDVVPGDVCSSIIIAACAATAQRARHVSEPLVVHACTSTTSPETLYGWWDIAYRYWSANPAPVRLTLGGYPRMDTAHPPAGMSDRSWAFFLRTGLAQAKFWVLSGLLQLFGHSLLAAKLWNGWQAWKTYNRGALDFNLFFCSRASRHLEAALPTDEAASLQCVWRAGQDDWVPYLHSHFDHIRFLHFRQAAYAPQLKGQAV